MSPTETRAGADLLTAATIADPFPLLAELRESDPVHWSERHSAWLVTRYDDCVAAYADPRLSSDRVNPLLAQLSDERRAQMGDLLARIADWMVTTDPPLHSRLRRLAGRAFNPPRIAALGDRIGQLVDELLDEFIGSGEQDLFAGFAYPLPATVIAEILGAPVEDRDRFRTWSDEVALVAFGAGGDARADRHQRALAGVTELYEYLHWLIERARASPGEDMLSALLEGDGSGEVLSDDEIASLGALMLFAGHETTSNLLSRIALALCQYPDERERLVRDPELAKKAVEEILRFDGPAKVLTRWVVEGHERLGRRIEAGQRVMIIGSSANRDPARFPEPDRLDLGRSPNPHIAFGKGIHACIGAQLARLEGRIGMMGMVRRLPGLQLADPAAELHWIPSLASRGLERLDVEFDRREAGER
ncbi:MAG TPA: cytochrome P450 [Solirubrobacteraceae bacterium]|jgi:cytochrome P450|nr:cytochrome P450 [Solirubrobacteraceae bacterium]